MIIEKRQRECSGKAGHASYGDAERVLRRMVRSSRFKSVRGMSIYRCKHCQKFHIGNMRRR